MSYYLKMLFGFSLSKGKLPDFLIIGAQKAGTTSLFHYVSQHPGIQVPLTSIAWFFNAMSAAGATITQTLREMPYGTEFYMADPDGHILAFLESK